MVECGGDELVKFCSTAGEARLVEGLAAPLDRPQGTTGRFDSMIYSCTPKEVSSSCPRRQSQQIYEFAATRSFSVATQRSLVDGSTSSTCYAGAGLNLKRLRSECRSILRANTNTDSRRTGKCGVRGPSDADCDLKHPGEFQQDPCNTWRGDFRLLWALLLTPLNIFLVVVPLSLASPVFEWEPALTFWLSFASLIPLCAILGRLTEDLALRTGELSGSLLSAALSNATEMLLIIHGLRKELLTLVQASLLGSILSNLLLLLGVAFCCGGIVHHVQKFNSRGAACSTSLLLLANFAFITPTLAIHENTPTSDQLKISRWTAALIAATYALFLVFQVASRNRYQTTQLLSYRTNTTIADRSASGSRSSRASLQVVQYDRAASARSLTGEKQTIWKQEGAIQVDRSYGSEASAVSTQHNNCGDSVVVPPLSIGTCMSLAGVTILLIYFVAEQLIGAVPETSEQCGMPQPFIGAILLPVVCNVADHTAAAAVALRNKPDLTMGLAVSSSTQVAMLVVPFAVIAGWVMHIPMSLAFSKLSAAMLTLSILIVFGVVQDGESNWLEGVMLIVAYCITALVFWFAPTAADSSFDVRGATILRETKV